MADTRDAQVEQMYQQTQQLAPPAAKAPAAKEDAANTEEKEDEAEDDDGDEEFYEVSVHCGNPNLAQWLSIQALWDEHGPADKPRRGQTSQKPKPKGPKKVCAALIS